ncbi:ATP-binding protein [Bradyrhizobium sp. CER78]|uniref:ATP-binding protein n=1 Tax=Bradyrhizobium sp. CER78 TaxID=3039162 RepID=UPI00244D0C64|nr:ATP-binding protein [Bradyrhizobium sp. CER78]MDH2384983.1 ATP-binding protein [Bradyrhizobium sp. CER78]
MHSALKVLIVFAVILTGSLATAADKPKHIIVLQSNGQNFKPWSEYLKAFRQELERQSPLPTVVQTFPVAIAPDSESAERQLAEYLNALYLNNPPDLIVAFGAPAAGFAQRHRAGLFPATPMLLAAIDARRIQETRLGANDAVVPVWIDISALFGNILQVLPKTQTIAVVIGNSPNEQFWVQEIQSRLGPLKDRVNLLFWNDLSFEEILRRAATLPRDSAIFWIQPQIDVTGAVHEGERALKRLHAVANAPIFSHDDAFFAGEIVGGPMTSVEQGSTAAADVAARILGGTKAGEIRTPVLQYGPAKYDWRELKRWGIPESRLPPGSEILFRPPSTWDLYRWQVLALFLAIFLQAVLITVLLYERRGRLSAEIQLRQRMSELAHVNRYSTAGELTASIAHELNQPLGAILVNAESMEKMLASPSPDIGELLQIASDIRRDDERAGKVIQHVRSLMKKTPIDIKPLDLNDVVSETLDFVSSLAIARDVQLRGSTAQVPLPVNGDRTQLQQVLLNLIVNALDATADKPIRERIITIRTWRSDHRAAFSTSDTGPGIAAEHLQQIFEPFFSMKPAGMGMGLSIARTIVEAHGGTITAHNQSHGGAIFSVTLPLIG